MVISLHQQLANLADDNFIIWYTFAYIYLKLCRNCHEKAFNQQWLHVLKGNSMNHHLGWLIVCPRNFSSILLLIMNSLNSTSVDKIVDIRHLNWHWFLEKKTQTCTCGCFNIIALTWNCNERSKKPCYSVTVLVRLGTAQFHGKSLHWIGSNSI